MWVPATLIASAMALVIVLVILPGVMDGVGDRAGITESSANGVADSVGECVGKGGIGNGFGDEDGDTCSWRLGVVTLGLSQKGETRPDAAAWEASWGTGVINSADTAIVCKFFSRKQTCWGRI